ncbi:hypothetical protein ACFLVG_02640 [Chloroflexota bacterium]
MIAIRSIDKKRVIYSVLGATLLAVLVFGSSIYAKNTLNPTELSHFFMPFPAGKVVRPMTVKQLDGSSIFVRPIVINVDKRGILKKVLNPGVEGLSTHWLDNIDTKPHRIGMKFTNVNVEVKWGINAGIPWNEETRTFDVSIGAGERVPDLGVDWLFFFPPDVRAKDIWYDGSLIIYDADTTETLTTIPVKFQKEASK